MENCRLKIVCSLIVSEKPPEDLGICPAILITLLSELSALPVDLLYPNEYLRALATAALPSL